MIDIPENISNDVFNKEFKRGSIIKTLFRCSDGKQRYKYFIILNHDLSQEPVAFILTTSQTEFYDKHPHFNKDIVRIPAQKLKFFPKETILNCREIHKESKQVLKKNFQNNTLKFVGILLPNIMQDVDNVIAQSFLISPSDKKLILGK